MKHMQFITAFISCFAALAIAQGTTGDVNITGTNSQVLKVCYAGTSWGSTAVLGDVSGIGTIGVKGSGGVNGNGVKGVSNSIGTDRLGVYGWASGGSVNYAVFGYARTGTAWAGYFNGNVYATGFYPPSDITLKKNISPLANVLPDLMKIRTVNYEFDSDKNSGFPKGKRIGLISQNIEEVFPDCIKNFELPRSNGTASNDSSASKTYKAVNYMEMVAVLISAIQEQQTKIAELKKIVSTQNTTK